MNKNSFKNIKRKKIIVFSDLSILILKLGHRIVLKNIDKIFEILIKMKIQ